MIAQHKIPRYVRYTVTALAVLSLYLVVQRSQSSDKEVPLVLGEGSLLDSPHLAINDKSNSFGSLFAKLGKGECPSYVEYSKERHAPFSTGDLRLPFQRPRETCRTFKSEAVEKVIVDFKERLKDSDLARMFENCLPNTLHTTILWHKPSEVADYGDDEVETTIPDNLAIARSQEKVKNANNRKPASKAKKQQQKKPPKHYDTYNPFDEFAKYSQSFIVTGDIHAEWLRDSAWQLSAYQKLAKYDNALRELITGAINTQARFIVYDPYCNAFQPPIESNVKREKSAIDSVFPPPNWKNAFECKWELDSLVSFLALTNQYYESTQDKSIFNDLWKAALETILVVIKRESLPTFSPDGKLLPFKYTFQRDTNVGSETLPLTGSGNPVNFNTKMVRSAFRPSDDACIFQLFVPANAYLVAELNKISKTLAQLPGYEHINVEVTTIATNVNASIYEYGAVTHPEFGKVFAYEVDGYNSALFMDDANIPSLLSLPDLGFVDASTEIYQNTRKMILTKRGNPYYLPGRNFRGIGGPHVGYKYAWPMSLLVKIRTSSDDEEITADLRSVMENTGFLGLMHEGVNVNSNAGIDYTRPWFAWCNSEFGKTILDLAERKPHLIFKEKYANVPYIIDKEFKDVRF